MRTSHISPCFVECMRLGNILFSLAAAAAHAKDVNVPCRIPWLFSDVTMQLRVYLGAKALPVTPHGKCEYPTYTEPARSYRKIPDTITHGSLVGYFQSPKYFEHHEEYIRDMFKALTIPEKEKDTVGIHIRLGDYKDYDEFHIIDEEYLKEAAKHLSPSIKRIVLFSDDHFQAARMIDNIPAFKDMELVVDTHPTFEALRRMTAMPEMIISASSFSWWGAWLGKAEKVIAPKTWFDCKIDDYQDIYLPNWIRL